MEQRIDGADPLVEQAGPGGAPMLVVGSWSRDFPWLRAGMSTRLGGVSRAPRESLNCALHVGDRPEDVIENRRRAAEAAGFDFANWVCAEQVHGSNVAIVDAGMSGAGARSREEAVPSSDAMATDVPGVMLNAFFADCVPLWFVDPVRRAVGVAHAGWRGSVADVAGETVRAMRRAFRSEAGDLFAVIGPSIRGCCYEVDDAVARHIPRPNVCLRGTGGSPERYRLDLAEFNRQKLIEAGILMNRIEISQYCTNCRTDLFFSHRGEHGQTGRMTAWIGLKE